MTNFKAIILEDSISHSWDYEMILDSLDVRVVGVFKSWKEALPVVKKDIPDFIIVDLFLENSEKGLDFIREIKDHFIPMIICTGYPEKEYMDEALSSGVKAFLTKPVDKAALTFQVRKLMQELSADELSKDFLIVKDKRNLIKVPFGKIFKIEIDGNYSMIYLVSNKKYVIKLSLKKLITKLDDRFVRSHRSAVVNMAYVEKINSNNSTVVLKSGLEVELGNTFKNEFKKAFNQS